MTRNIEDTVRLLDEFEDWKQAQKYRDTSSEAFLLERETTRLARNAQAVLLFLKDWREENSTEPQGDDGFEDTSDGIVNVVAYLLNAEAGNAEVEEWIESDTSTEANEIKTFGFNGQQIISEQTLTSYNSEEGYYEDSEF